jgi:decaprenyl-phosphate phosphoribosyltransferase
LGPEQCQVKLSESFVSCATILGIGRDRNACRTPLRYRSGWPLGMIALLRPKQWLKNAFVLAPLLFSGEFANPESMVRGFLAAILFALASSSGYIVNDLCDVDSDRQHPVKRTTRPLAAGVVSKGRAIFLLIAVYVALGCGLLLLPTIIAPIALYLALNLAYSLFLKHQPVLDIFTIAIGFVIRVYAGAVALPVPLSEWMFVTTLCLALYFASIKRRQELKDRSVDTRKVLENYSIPLTDRFAEMSATGAILFYSLYVMSTKPELVVTIPIVFFGLFRYWYAVEALGKGESPADVFLADWQLVITAVVWVSACVWALWPMRG